MNTSPSPTPAPWHWRKYGDNWMLWGPNSTAILFLPGGSKGPIEHPDGFLIEAAPLLLDALCRVEAEMGNRISQAAFNEFSQETKDKLKVAIAAALGRP